MRRVYKVLCLLLAFTLGYAQVDSEKTEAFVEPEKIKESPKEPELISPSELEKTGTNKIDTSKDTDKVEKTIMDEIFKQGENQINHLVNTAKKNADQEIDLRDKKNKNGFVLGTQIILKKFEISQVISGFQKLTSTVPSLDAGLILGYQYYLAKNFGFRISGLIDAGSPAVLKAQTLQPAQTSSPSEATGANSIPATLIRGVYQKYWPVKGSVELSFLIDFYTSQKHVFGAMIGGGYEIEWGVLVNADASVGTNTSGLTRLVQKPQNVITSGLYPLVGLYYYYRHHQLGINYRIGEFYLIKEKNNEWDFNLGNSTATTITKFRPLGSLTLYYLYRF